MSNSAIRKLFEDRLKDWADLNGYSISWQNVIMDSEPDDIYLKAFLLPGGTDSLDLNNSHRMYVGVFQVSVVAPDGEGPQNSEAVAEEIEALYPKGIVLDDGSISVQTLTPMSIFPSIISNNKYEVPVSCEYRCDTFV